MNRLTKARGTQKAQPRHPNDDHRRNERAFAAVAAGIMALMDDLVLVAAHNNARWCDIVCQSHGMPTAFSNGMWCAPQGSPSFYPDAVTLTPGLCVDSVLALIDAVPGCSVKDSFADLDLSKHGFDLLFNADWLYREPTSAHACSDHDWRPITIDDDLTRWAAAAGLNEIIRPELLHDPTVRVLSVRAGREVAAGAIINRTGETVGLSNVFTHAIDPASVWRDLPAAIAAVFPGVPIVGYEHGSQLAAASDAGFDAIGRLRVWIKPSVR